MSISESFAMPTNQSTPSSVATARPRLSLKIARIEYRIQWDEAAGTWDVLRNGAATDVVARRKFTSAVASAIRDAKAEFKTSNLTVIVTCLEGYKLETLWKGTQ
jgi:multidrug resistance efflux pump